MAAQVKRARGNNGAQFGGAQHQLNKPCGKFFSVHGQACI
jgi:hypothetical protein